MKRNVEKQRDASIFDPIEKTIENALAYSKCCINAGRTTGCVFTHKYTRTIHLHTNITQFHRKLP